MRTDVSVGVSLTASEMPTAREVLRRRLTEHDEADTRLAAGLVDYVLAQFADADTHLRTAYLAYKRSGDRRRAAVAAAHLARLEYDGLGNMQAASGWLGRAQRLIASEPRCPELGWVLLSRVGCSFVDNDELERSARESLELAADFDLADLECKALADLGVALATRGRTTEGNSLLDESMTMITSGECDNAFIAAQVWCCSVTACERSGDLNRMEAMLRTVEANNRVAVSPTAAPNLLLAHCQGEYGSMLCGSGRWKEADVALQKAVRVSELVHYRPRARAHAVLADLRVSQGRIPEAAMALEGYADSIESQLPLTRLHLARGDLDLATTVARRAVHRLAGDAVRSAPLLACIVQAEIGRGELVRAEEACGRLDAIALETSQPHLRAIALLASARLANARSDQALAIQYAERGMAALGNTNLPLLAADLHLELARTLAGSDTTLAMSEARAALQVYAACGSALAHEAQSLLHSLGGTRAPNQIDRTLRELTKRERQVLHLLANGATNPDIARSLVISPKTAEHHVSNILRKLGLTSRHQAAVYAATLPESG